MHTSIKKTRHQSLLFHLLINYIPIFFATLTQGGRAFGDLFITLMGLISIRNLLNLLILPGAALVVLSMVLIRYNYSILAV